MAVLQKGKSLYPFWGESISIITGLDPLGLQNTSEATYAKLLPGISNLTNRLRYYGFYCWLLDFYFQRERRGNSSEQYRFIRRAELMIAIIMQSERKNITQITGSNFASNLLNHSSDNYFDLKLGADKDEIDKDVYWKYPSGAFGQYYYGAMQAISLVITAANEDGDIIYNISQPHPRQNVSGKQLAEAFDNTLTKEIKELFYNNVKKGRLNVNDIPELISFFAIESINVKTEEWSLYAKMLLDKDEPSLEIEELMTFHRKETIISLITFSKINNYEYNWYLFLLECYKTKLGTQVTPSSDTNVGWYSYQLNEYWQYSCGTVFWGLLQHLYCFQRDQYLPTFVKDFAKKVTDEISKNHFKGVAKGKTVGDLIAILPSNSEEETREQIGVSQSDNPIETTATGFKLLLQLYKNNREELLPLKEFMNRKQTERDGNMVDGIIEIGTSMSESLNVFIEKFVLRKIIYRHQMVALRKMGNGSVATHKFLIEEQYIRFIDNFPPRNTSPRMIALQNILSDLKIINTENELLPLYKQLLNLK